MTIKLADIPKDQILGYEPRHVVFSKSKFGSGDDIHYVKEIVHTRDGRTFPNTRIWKNYKRDFYVTQKGHRNHKQPKEWEDINKLNKFTTTQTQLNDNIAKALGMPGFKGDYKSLFRSPYLYGADILSTAVLKRMYQDKFPELITPYSVAAFDTEKDMVRGTDQINMATISFKGRVYTAVVKSFFEGHSNVIPRLKEALVKYIGEYVTKRNIDWEIELVDTDIDVIKRCMAKGHEWQPDFMAIWNMNFDVPLMLDALARERIDPATIFSDPSLPREFQFFNYKQGPNKKITDSGKVFPLKPSDQWHTVFCPASFYFIDPMCAYRRIRLADGEEPSYALDAILDKKLGIRKLKFKEADHLSKGDWHIFMQQNYPFEYVIYNVFDCVSMEELDEVTNDLQFSLPSQSGCSDFANFKSQPRRLVDDLHYVCLNQDKVIGVTSDELKTDLDKETLGLEDWICTLPAALIADNGLRLIEEDPNLSTNIRVHVADLDVAASYPNGGAVFNISKETTLTEVCSLEGIDEETLRLQSINLSGGQTNAVEFCTTLLGFPDPDVLLDLMISELNLEVIVEDVRLAA